MKYLIIFVTCSVIITLSVVNIVSPKASSEEIKNKDKKSFKLEFLTESKDVVCMNNFVYAYLYRYSKIVPIFSADRLPMTCEEFKGE